MIWTRRALLSALAAAAATAAKADLPLAVPRPRARVPLPPARPAAPPLRVEFDDLVEASGLGDGVCVLLRDLTTGETLWQRSPARAMMPASTTKSVTALYALDRLGADHRFTTRLRATGPVTGGIIQGDLILAGGGDPVLDTDALAQMATDLAAAGVTGLTGAFHVWTGALPYEEEIEPGQHDHLGYNPSVSGLNLNFNRVHFQWRRAGADYTVTFDARSATLRPAVSLAKMQIVDRRSPVYTSEGLDHWTVSRAALGKEGARWLPVRQPGLYAGEVFRVLAADQGVTLPAPRKVEELPAGEDLVTHDSPSLTDILRGMLYHSTNLTAEVVGLAASATEGLPADIDASAARMNAWLADRFGVTGAFVDHSGLSDENRISAADMVTILSKVPDQIQPLLKHIKLYDGKRPYPGHVAAKTGTLNFVSALAGYVDSAQGRRLVFAILSADEARREAVRDSLDDLPPGASSWNTRAKALQNALLRRWSLMA